MNFIDDGTIEWKDLFNEFNIFFINDIRISEDYEEIYKWTNTFYKFIYDIIHNKLFERRELEENETEIRNLVKYVINKMLPFINVKIRDMNNILNRSRDERLAKLLLEYYDLEDNLYALASFRSLIHYAHYMERQDDQSQLVWKYNMEDTMGGIFYYSNMMILNKNCKIKNMIKQCPTGYGKSKSDCVIISFCFGYDINDDIMKMVGNKSLVSPITTNIVNMMTSKRFSKVFPQYAKYNNSKDMFSKCSISSGELALVDSKKSLSFACYNKETAIDGGRFNKQFYDDITQSDDKENVTAHKKDIARHDNQWKKRQYDEFSCIRWYTGTAYHREDLISYVRKYHKANKPLVKDNSTSKFKWNAFIKLNSSGDCVYIDVPKLADLELGEDKCYCTFPQKYSKVEALKQMHSSQNAYRTFMAMEQQKPLPPISLAFDYHYLLQYKELPNKETLENVVAVIDPNRTGKDNYCCMIFNKYKDDEFYYLVDIYYKKTSPKISIPKICTLMSNKKVMDISFESNTTDSYLFEKEVKTTLINYGWNEFKINSFYSYLKKDEKIAKYQDDIKEKIKFPMQGMYYEDSDMGRAMADIVNYSLDGKNGNDDSIDCCAMLCVKLETKTKNEIKIFNFKI